jgi:hypothetical protein
MSHEGNFSHAVSSLLDREEVEGVLSGAFYSPAMQPRIQDKPLVPKPTHYKVICISLYNDDIDHLDAMVDALKARGLTKANRSALIRHALAQVDLDKVPRGI